VLIQAAKSTPTWSLDTPSVASSDAVVSQKMLELDTKQQELDQLRTDCNKLSQSIETMRLGVGTQLELESLKHDELLRDLRSLEDKVVTLHAITHADDETLEKIDEETHAALVKLRSVCVCARVSSWDRWHLFGCRVAPLVCEQIDNG
jgi:hypothetical protein